MIRDFNGNFVAAKVEVIVSFLRILACPIIV